MTQKNRTNLISGINAAINDNTTGEISAADVRDAIKDVADSALNLLTDDSDDLAQGSSNLFMTAAERSKLDGLENGVTGTTNATLTLSGTTLGLNLANANTWTGQQTFNNAASIHGVGVVTSKIYPVANSTNAFGIYRANGTTQILFVDTTNSRIGIGAAPTAYNFELRSAGNIAAWIGTTYSSFGYTIGRNLGTGFLDILGNQTGFSGINVDRITCAGSITIAGNPVIQNWATTLGLGFVGAGSTTPSAVLEIRGGNQNILLGGGSGFSYHFQRSSVTGFLEITGQQVGFSGLIISMASKSSALTMNDGGSIGIGRAINSISALLHLAAGTATANNAPLKFTTGINLTTPEVGAFEYNNTPHFTNSDATRRHIALAPNATKVTAGAPYTNDGYVVINIGGTDFKVMTTT